MTEEKNDPQTDSTTEEEALGVEEQETQLDPKHRTPAFANLIAGYALALGLASCWFRHGRRVHW